MRSVYNVPCILVLYSCTVCYFAIATIIIILHNGRGSDTMLAWENDI